MAYFPLFIELEGASCLIVGGGQVALRKAEKLLPYGACITVIAEHFIDAFECFSQVQTHQRSYEESDLEGRSLVIAATDDNELNDRIAKTCHSLKIPVNVVDDKEKCGFLFPALVKRGPLSIGISSAGSSPSAARYDKGLVEAVLPPVTEEESFNQVMMSLASQRDLIKERISDENTRAKCFEKSFQKALSLKRPLNSSELELIISEEGEKQKKEGRVTLLGAGCGTLDWLTVQGVRVLLTCDAIVYDALIDINILNINPNVKRYPVGKRCGRHAKTQSEINSLLIDLAKQGLKVLRLKGGDPFVFGRGGEEVLALKESGIACEYIPGISSAIAIPGEAGIPLTHRKMSRAFHVMTAHTADEMEALVEEAKTLVELKGTLVFLMGLLRLEKIVTALLAAGKSPSTAVAVISGGNSEHPNCVRSDLANIVSCVRDASVKAPAVIVIGEVASLHLL